MKRESCGKAGKLTVWPSILSSAWTRLRESSWLRLAGPRQWNMDAKRGIRMTQDRLLSDLTPNPGYVVEWTVALHSDMKTGGALLIMKEVA